MKLWDKGYTIENAVEEFTIGNDRILDNKLAKYDIQGTMAHIQMLHEINILSANELNDLTEELNLLLELAESGNFTIPEGFEDVHSYVEYLLIEKLGDAGKKVHTGRSRNDQVLVDLHLYIKDEITQIKTMAKSLFDQLIGLSTDHKEQLLPGYTHLQVAMPSSFGLWFGAYAECIIDDLVLLDAAYKIADQNPLGSAAGYGSSFPLNRKRTTELLRFHTLKYNSVAAQMSRGKVEKTTAVAMAGLASTLSRFAMDVCLYMSQNFGFITFPDHLTTGSSIMPHKKNPDVFELVRGKCNKLQALPTELSFIVNNLPSGYHRDYQLLKESLLPAIESMKSCIEITTFMLEHIIINKDIMNDPKYDYLYSVEAVNEKVMQGKSFRTAYKEVGEQVQSGTFQPKTQVNHTHEGSIGNLCNDQITEKMKKLVL